jgi:hypothetical protein
MQHIFDRSALAILALFAASLLGHTPARGDGISTLHGTGQGLSTGVVDPNFTIASAPSGAVLKPGGATDTIPPVTSPAYVSPPAGLRWIGPTSDNSVQQPVGNYDFRTTFDLTGLDPATAQVAGSVAADNKVADIKLNGVSLGISGGSLGSMMNFSITKGFSSGINTLDFIVRNDETGGPAALMVSEIGTASAVPEPSALAVFTLATVGLAVVARRKPRSN